MEKTIAKQLEEVQSLMCDKYCKYPTMPVPEGKSEGWLFEDDGPCEECPLAKLI